MSTNTSWLKSNQLKANGGNNAKKLKGYTNYDAIRLIELNKKIYINLKDPTFSGSYLYHGKGRQEELDQHGKGNYMPYTLAMDCKKRVATSTANLKRTIIKFLPSQLSKYRCSSWCHDYRGWAELSSNNQVMAINARGYCGATFFMAPFISGMQLLQVTF